MDNQNHDERERFEIKRRIVERAEQMGIGVGTRATRMMDVDFADKQFSLRLEDWLAADDGDFAHDFIGIQANMNRETCMVENLFCPRFAESQHGTREHKMCLIANSIARLANCFIRDRIEITYRRETEDSVKDFTDWGRQQHGIVPGDEYFYVWRGALLYAVNVTADSYLTAAEELMRKLALKF